MLKKFHHIWAKATILILLLQLLSNGAFSQKVYVNKEASLGGNGESWETAYKYLMDGLKEAGGFDTIWVAKGIYYPDESELNYATDNDPTSYFSFFSKQLKIFGGFFGNETLLNQRNVTENLTILSGDIEQNDVTDSNIITPDTSSVVGRNSYNIFYWYGGSTPQMTINGFVFTGGFADGDFSEESIEGTETGGGLSNSWRANGGKTEVILKNLNFIGNYGNYGASMYIYNGEGEASFVIDSCNFKSNASSHSIVRLTGYYSEFVPELNNLKFLDNSGNALHLDLENTIYDNRTFYLQNSSFINNQKAINIDADGYTKLLFNNLEIVNNQTGIYLNNIAGLHLDIYNSKLISNQTGLNFSNQNFFESNIHNTVFSSHEISISLGNDGSPKPIEIGNCTFVENDQSISSFGADVNLKNSIVYGYQIDPNNQFSFTSFAEINVANSIIKGSGGSTNWNSDFGTDAGNNLDTDPLFINVYGGDSVIGSTDDDYRIGGFSPAVDNGNNSLVPLDKYDFNHNGDSTEILPYDLYLNPRISTFRNTNIVDMGAFEFGNNIEIVNVNISDTIQTFDNTPKEVSAQANLNNLNIVVYYNDQSSLPTDAGTYSIIAFINEIDYYGADTSQLIIKKAEGFIEVTDLEQVYDGTAKSVSVNTSPSDLNILVTYDGSASQPSDAETYQVIVTIDEQNYEGTDTTQLIIEKAEGHIEVKGLEQVYDGTAKSISVSTTPSDLNTSVTYDGSASQPTNAGTYQVIVTIDEQNYEGADTAQFIVEKAEGLIEVTGLEQVYDGTAKSISVSTTPSDLNTSVTYDGSASQPTNAGTYQVIVTIDEQNYEGADTAQFIVEKAEGLIEVKGLEQVYDGTAKSISVSTTPSDLNTSVTYDGSASQPTNAGTYQVIVTIDEQNYEGTDTTQLIIEKAEGHIEVKGLEQVYDGTAKSISVSTTPSDLNTSVTYDGSASQPTNAGTYQVIVTIDEQNYEGADTAQFIVEKAEGLIEVTGLEQMSDGTAKSISVSTTPSDLNTSVTYDGSASQPTNAGTYQVIVTIDEQNYEGADTAQFIVEKAEGLIEVTDLEQLYDGTAKSVSVNTTPSGLDFIILYDGSPDKPIEIGEYIVTVKIEEANYYGTATVVLLINSITGINDEKLLSKIFPNPSSKELKIKVDDIILYLEIIDGNGKTVLTLNPHQSELSLDISDLKAGVYFLILGTFNERVVKRVIKY
jgi:hypothetical protein